MSSVSKGNDFELEIQRILRNMNIESYQIKLANGDGGKDLMGNYAGNLLLFQCKNYAEKNKVTVDDIRQFEGVMSRYPGETIGVFVVPSKTNNYTRRATEEANNSKYTIILTDKLNICHDILSKTLENYNNDDNFIRFRIDGKISNKYILLMEMLKGSLINYER
ncbi:3061_t:CDS:2 [Diversispora eburnea]|uniref:3061_t:CDS:1 n=1 Tax=Diversispora eburnea TaxID=1213867 RepID=A0A9N8V2I3_9GLOM|nr:3061_t:CDS:2 [Diversispora eburnea]